MRRIRIALFSTIALVLALTSALGTAAGAGVAAPEGPQPGATRVPVLILFSQRPGPAEEALVRGAGGTIKYRYQVVSAIAATLPEPAVNALRANPNVRAVELDGQVQTVDHGGELNNTWGVEHIGAGDVHHSGNVGGGVRVAVLDTGIDADHPDVRYDPSCSRNFTSADPTAIADGHSHGTHVAGTIAALLNGTGVVGAAPQATLCVLKVLDDSGNGNYSDIVAAIDFVASYNLAHAGDPIRVTNNSYGGSQDPGLTVKQAFDSTSAAGVLHVGAAGNSGNFRGRGENCIYPARWDSVIAVAATTPNDTRASFSSTCPEVELAAPGYQINSTVPDGYGVKSGTSMASPHVAGVAALVLAANSSLANGQVRAILQDTAQDLGAAGRDTHYGFGLVDAVAAVAAAGGGSPPPEPEDGAIAGTVTDTSGNPIAGATVDAAGMGRSVSATTGPDGRYEIAGLSPGTYTVTASADGYVDESQFDILVDDGATTTVDFALTAEGTPPEPGALNVTLGGSGTGVKNQWFATVTIAVSDGNGAPVSGATINGTWSGGFSGPATCTTNFSGQCSVTSGSVAKKVGSITFTVDSVTVDGVVHDGDGASITVSKS